MFDWDRVRFGSKCSILNGQVIYIETSKLNIANMLLIPLDISHKYHTAMGGSALN